MIIDDPLVAFLLAPFIEDHITGLEGVPTGSMYQAVCTAIMGIAKENALKGLSIEFLVVFFGDVYVSLASENTDKGNIGFISTPGLLGGDVLVEGARRDDVV